MSPLLGLLLLLTSVALALVAVPWLLRERARGRLYAGETQTGRGRPRGLARWLVRAGFRRRRAPAVFVACCVGALALAGVAVLLWLGAGLGELLVAGVGVVPGPAGALMALVLQAGPLILFASLALAPWLLVRSARRARVTAIEQDLPVSLELLATLGEAGFGFDAAVDRLVASQPAGQPLVGELRLYQRDALAGMPRIEALRRLAERVDIPAMTVLATALIQSEQMGSSLAGVLRTQAEDLRNLRRERALAQAESLEVKLVFPLVICFLPGLFVAAAGPAFYQFVQLIDRIARGGG